MPGTLHEKMVTACRRDTNIQLKDGKELRKLPYKNKLSRIPDLYSGNKLAIEALTFTNGGSLEKFGYTYKNLVLVIPVPDNITEVWLYDPAIDAVVERLRRSIDKVRAPRIELVCLKCNYKWVPRTHKMPKMCPQCKRRNWNERLRYGTTAKD